MPEKDGVTGKVPPKKDTSSVDMLALMHDFILAVQAQDATVSYAPEAEKALMLFKQLVQGVK